MNTRNSFGKGYKVLLQQINEHTKKQLMRRNIEYLKGLTDIKGKYMVKTSRRAGVIGFIIGVMSVFGVYDTFVKPDSSIKHLLIYKLSQDYLELFYCTIRSCGGWCQLDMRTIHIRIQKTSRTS